MSDPKNDTIQNLNEIVFTKTRRFGIDSFLKKLEEKCVSFQRSKK